MRNRILAASSSWPVLAAAAVAEPPREPARRFTAADVFNLEYANRPADLAGWRTASPMCASPADIMTDRFRRSIWIVDEDGKTHGRSPRARAAIRSPACGRRTGAPSPIVPTKDGATEIRVYRLRHRSAPTTLARLPDGASNLSWSPDGKTLAFQMFVEERRAESAALAGQKPEGAEWNGPARVIDQVDYRADGAGCLKTGFTQIFVLPADGGTPRQLTWAARNHDGRCRGRRTAGSCCSPPTPRKAGNTIRERGHLFARHRRKRRHHASHHAQGSRERPRPCRRTASASPIPASTTTRTSYQVSELYVANADGSSPRKSLTASLDRDISDPQWAGNGAIWFLYRRPGR